MNITTENFWNDATFLPHDDPSRIEQLLQKVYEKREIDLIAFCLKVISSDPSLSMETGFAEKFNLVKDLAPEKRKKLIKNPVYIAWLRQTTRVQSDKSLLQNKLSDFGRVLESALEEKKAGQNDLLIEEQRISVKRFEIDPIILEASFPEYKLPDEKRQNLFEKEIVYPEAFFREMLEIALERIKNSWSEAYRNFPKFVNLVVDMVDGEYTSYSSADHTGAIFVSTDNSPLVALEEFLIHEFGHQIMYHVMELDPVVTDTDTTVYKLPWSGNERDFYGYFHAFYIYIFIALYLTRVKNRSRREQRRVELRKKHIMKGLEETVRIFDRTENFTGKGKILYDNLKTEVTKLTY